MNNLVIFGTGRIAEVISFYFTHETEYRVLGFCEEQSRIKVNRFCDLPVMSIEELVNKYPPNKVDVFVAIGYQSHNKIREYRYTQLKGMGYNFPSFISKHTTYYGTSIGENCMVFENNVIQPFVEIGNNVFLWSGNHIGHHSVIADNCFISSHVVVSGNCTIEKNCFLGVNSTLRDGISIGAESVVGAGATVMKNAASKTIILPARSTIKQFEHEIL